MRVLALIPLWRRPAVARMTMRSLIELDTDHTIDIAVSVSPDDPDLRENMQAASRYCVRVTQTANLPLADKHNASLYAVKDLDWDYLMIMGSDNPVSPNWFANYEGTLALRHAAFGVQDLYVMNQDKLYYWPGYVGRQESIGAGRIISREAVERTGYKLWQNGQSAGLDGAMTRLLGKRGCVIPYRKMLPGTYLVDIKDDVSMTSFDSLSNSLSEVGVPEWLTRLYGSSRTPGNQ